MNQNMPELKRERGKDIKTRYQHLKQRQPAIRSSDAARMLGVSEGELMACRVGEGATRLMDDPVSILKNLLPLGEVLAITRNRHCVHERKGVYNNYKFHRHGQRTIGLFLNPEIDLRLFMEHWKHCFACTEQTKTGAAKCLQFFDRQGQAVHKIYLTTASNEDAYHQLISEFRHSVQATEIEIENHPPVVASLPDDEIDWPGFRNAWKNLRDVHDFFPMLRKFGACREQGFRHIGTDFACQVECTAVRRVLELAQQHTCEIMVFTGNRGCIQIHTGVIKNLMQHETWFNVLDPRFNLHLEETGIVSAWIVKKPTDDGFVTSLEIFDAHNEVIAMFFGKRKPGIPEQQAWRDILDTIPAKEDCDVA